MSWATFMIACWEGTISSRRWLALILVLSILPRIVVAFYLGDVAAAPDLVVDQVSYYVLGTRVASGHGFSFPQPWYPFTPADAPTAHWSFLQALYLAGNTLLFGPHPLAARLLTAVLGGLLLPWMAYRLARRLLPGREHLALLAAACAAGYAFFILYAALLLTETFFIIALLWSLERALALAERPSRGRAATLGLSLGLAALFRQSILPWVPVLFLWLLWKGWREGWLARAFRRLLLAGVVLLACILPFTIRNYVVYGEFLLLNSNTGYAMYSAQHPMHGISFIEHGAAPLPDDLVGQGLNEAQWDRLLMRRGLQFVLDDPGRYLLLSLSRLLDFFEFWPTDTTLLHNVGRLASFTLFLPFFIYGIVLAIREAGPLRSRQAWRDFLATPVALALLFMVFYTILHVLTWAMPRYRLPVDAVAMPFAALALTDIWSRLPCSRCLQRGRRKAAEPDGARLQPR